MIEGPVSGQGVGPDFGPDFGPPGPFPGFIPVDPPPADPLVTVCSPFSLAI